MKDGPLRPRRRSATAWVSARRTARSSLAGRMDDVVIVGAGPAGALAAAILARRGLTVRLFDRARFPRHKLCGDTLNPGALDVLRRHFSLDTLVSQSAPIHGM